MRTSMWFKILIKVGKMLFYGVHVEEQAGEVVAVHFTHPKDNVK